MTPVSGASLGTRWAEIRLQSWPRSENFPAVGLRCVLFFIPRLVAGIKPVSQLFFYRKQSTPKDATDFVLQVRSPTAIRSPPAIRHCELQRDGQDRCCKTPVRCGQL